jgi:hypothetical protein
MKPSKPVDTPRTARVVAAALTLLVLGGVGAVKAGLAGSAFMQDLELVKPPLAHVAPSIQRAETPRLAGRVFVVIIDGLRLDRAYQLPFLDDLRRRGVDLELSSHYPTWSRPNYVSILTGVPPSASGVRTNHHKTPVTLDSLMDRATAAGLTSSAASDYALLPQLFLRLREPGTNGLDELDIDEMRDPLAHDTEHVPDRSLRSTFDDARYTPWPGGFEEAGAALVAGRTDLVVLLISSVDIAGHARGADSVEYRQAAESVDRTLGRMLARIDLTRDTILITADHGHTRRGGHGGVEPEVLAVPLVMAGAGVRPGATVWGGGLIDIPGTVAALLGIPVPGHALGRTLDELLDIDAATRARLRAADRARLDVTEQVVALADARAENQLLESRARRLGLVAGCALLASVLAAFLIRRQVLRLDWRVLVVSIPAFFIVYYALIGTVGQRFSPSLVPAQGNIAGAMFKYGAVGMVVQLLASMWALRKHRSLAQRLIAANGIAWTGLMLTMLAAGLAWAYFPPPYMEVPTPFWLVAIPAVEVGVACAAINVALTLGIEVIIFASRAWHRDVRTLD